MSNALEQKNPDGWQIILCIACAISGFSSLILFIASLLGAPFSITTPLTIYCLSSLCLIACRVDGGSTAFWSKEVISATLLLGFLCWLPGLIAVACYDFILSPLFSLNPKIAWQRRQLRRAYRRRLTSAVNQLEEPYVEALIHLRQTQRDLQQQLTINQGLYQLPENLRMVGDLERELKETQESIRELEHGRETIARQVELQIAEAMSPSELVNRANTQQARAKELVLNVRSTTEAMQELVAETNPETILRLNH